MFSYYRDKAEVSRLSYTGNKGSFSSTGEVYIGYLKVASDDFGSTSKGTMGKSFHFQTNINADIRESDRLKIDGKEYVAGAVTIHNGNRIKFLRVLLTLSPGLT